MLTPLIKKLVIAVFKLTDCGNGTELGSFAFVKNHRFIGFRRPSPSMRRPVDVKAHFRFLLYMSLFPFSQAASVAILPSPPFSARDSLRATLLFSFRHLFLPTY